MKRFIHISFALFILVSCESAVADIIPDEMVEEETQEQEQQQESQNEVESQDEQGSGGDIQHMAISIILKDKFGNNLLNPGNEGNLDIDNINASFGDCTYYINQDNHSFSESYGEFVGLFSEYLSGEPYIRFGWLNAFVFYENENIIFHWTIEKSDTVTVYNKFDADKYNVDRRFYLNGKQADSFMTIIIN